MIQCPYKHEMYKNEDKTITVGVYDNVIVGTGRRCAIDIMDYIEKVAHEVNITDWHYYNVMEEEDSELIAVTLGNKDLDMNGVVASLHLLYDQDLACMHCNMSRSMDEYHGQTPRVPEKVTLGENQILAYGSVQDLMTYEAAAEGIRWYLDKTEGQGEAMLADIGYSGYEIVLAHIQIGETHYAGDSSYVSVADAQRLVDEGLATYMEFD